MTPPLYLEEIESSLMLSVGYGLCHFPLSAHWVLIKLPPASEPSHKLFSMPGMFFCVLSHTWHKYHLPREAVPPLPPTISNSPVTHYQFSSGHLWTLWVSVYIQLDNGAAPGSPNHLPPMPAKRWASSLSRDPISGPLRVPLGQKLGHTLLSSLLNVQERINVHRRNTHMHKK